MALVGDGQDALCLVKDASQTQFNLKGVVIDAFAKPRSQGLPDLPGHGGELVFHVVCPRVLEPRTSKSRKQNVCPVDPEAP